VLPKAIELPTFSVPALTRATPVKALELLRVRVPLCPTALADCTMPNWPIVPVAPPEMMPLMTTSPAL